MTKKDYELLAAVILETMPIGGKDSDPDWKQWSYTVDVLTAALARDNPRFNRGRFLAACGVE